MDDEMSEMDDDVMLELELPEEEDVYEMKQKTEELQESLVSTRRKLRALVTENKKKVGQINKLKNTANEFAKSEKQYKEAINSLKTQLQEIALFTSNLTYAVKLMTENSTTKEEKLKILKKFDSAKNLKESKAIYESLESLLETTKKPAEKIVNEKINNKPKSSSSATLNESTAYRNPQLDRMLDIINKIK
jgi:erythromycin esterase-like protein